MTETKPRRLRRWLVRLGLAGVGLALLLVAWLLFFPVPIGWAINIASHRALPPESKLAASVSAATLRWHFGADELELTIDSPAATALAQPLARAERMRILVNKSAFFSGHRLPSRVEVTNPLLVLDFAGEGWPRRPLPAAPASSPAKPDPAALAALLPAPGVPFALDVQGFAVELRAPERTVTWKFRPITTNLARDAAQLRLDLALGLDGGARPVSFTGRLEGVLDSAGALHRLKFTAEVPAFSDADLPPLPFAPATLPPVKMGAMSFAVDGTVDLDKAALPEMNYRLLITEGSVTLPEVKSGQPVVLHRLEAVGHAYGNATALTFEKLTVALDSVRVVADGATVAVGDLNGAKPTSIHAKVSVTGPVGTDLVAWMPAAMKATLPFPPASLAEISLTTLTAELDASVTQNPVSGVRLRTLTADGQLNVSLNGVSQPLAFRAKLPAPDQNAVLHVELPATRPAGFTGLALLKDYPAVAALDVPVRATADLAFTAAGEWRSANVLLTVVAPGTVRAFSIPASQPGLPPTVVLPRDTPVRALELEAEATGGGANAKVSRLRIDLGGPQISTDGITARRVSRDGPYEISGGIALENFSGEFLAGQLPPDTFAALIEHGVTPSALLLDRLTGTFSATQKPGAKPEAAKFQGELATHIQGQSLNVGVDATLTGNNVVATVSLSALNPARFQLKKLPGDLPLEKMDLPLTVRAKIAAGLDGVLGNVEAHIEGGPGQVGASPMFNADVPIVALALDASANGALKNISVSSAKLDLGDARIGLGDTKLVLGGKDTPSRLSGAVTLENLTVARAIALWPADRQPELRAKVVPMLQDGTLTRAAFSFVVPFDPAKIAAARPTELKGDVKLTGLRATPPEAPGPVSLQEISAKISWPQAVVSFAQIAVPGASVPTATVTVSALDQAVPTVAMDAAFAADLSQAAAWLTSLKFKLPEGMPLDLTRLAGTTEGRLRASAPLTTPLEKFDPASVSAALSASVSGLVVPLTLAGHELGGGRLALSASATGGNYQATLDWKNFRTTVPGVLTGDADLVANAELAPGSDLMSAAMNLDVSRARLLFAGEAKLPPLAPVTANLKVSGWQRQTRPQVTIAAKSADVLGAPLTVSADVTLAKTDASLRFERANITDFHLGRTQLSAEVQLSAAGRMQADINAASIDAPGLITLTLPFLPQLLPAASTAPVPDQSAKPVPATITSLVATAKLAELELGSGFVVRDLALGGELRDGQPVSLSLTGREGAANTLTFSFTPAGDHQVVSLTVVDIPAWVRAVTSPLLAVKLPAGPISSAIADAAKVPVILKGGRLELRGDVRLNEPAKLFEGTFAVRDTTMIRPPVVLQLIALKTSRSMQVNPLLKEFSAKRIYFNETTAGLDGITLTASGLVDFLTLKSARYGLKDEAVYTDGKYGIFEFEVIGKRPTLGLKDVYLKENAVIRALGSESDLDFGDPDPPKK